MYNPYFKLEMIQEPLQGRQGSTSSPAAPSFNHNTVFDFGDTGIKVTTTNAPRYPKHQEFFYPKIDIDPLESLLALQGGYVVLE
jgi:hypothetical protein